MVHLAKCFLFPSTTHVLHVAQKWKITIINLIVTIKAILNVAASLRHSRLPFLNVLSLIFLYFPQNFDISLFILSWIYALIYFERLYAGFQWEECVFSTSAGFSFSQIHVFSLDFAGNEPSHILIWFVSCVLLCVVFNILCRSHYKVIKHIRRSVFNLFPRSYKLFFLLAYE